MIEVHGLSHRYGPLTAVEKLDFTVRRGEILGLLGPNGAGKSTTLRAIMGLLKPTAGRVHIGGFDIAAEGTEARRLLGYLPENVSLYRELRVGELLQFVAKAKGLARQSMAGEIERVVELCGVAPVRDRLIGFCSRGFRQRIGLAQALLGDPEALVLDEPTVGLDPAQVVDIRERIAELARQKAVILSTHVLDEASRLCSKVLILDRGRCVADDSPQALAAALSARPRLRLRCTPVDRCQAVLTRSAQVLTSRAVHERDEAAGFVVELRDQGSPAELVRELVKADCNVEEIRPERLGLEEVFLELVGHVPELSVSPAADQGTIHGGQAP